MHLQIFGALVETSMHLATIPHFKNGLKVHRESLSAPKISSCAANLWVHRKNLDVNKNSGRTENPYHIEGAPARLRFPVFRKTMSARVQHRPWSRELNVSLGTAGSTSAVGGSTSIVVPQVQRQPWAQRQPRRRSFSVGRGRVDVDRRAAGSTPAAGHKRRGASEEAPLSQTT